MEEGPSPYIAMILECEAAIGRIRAALRAGSGDDEAVGQDFERIRQAVTPRLTRYAMSVARLAPESADEALEAMLDRLFEDIWSLGYVSLETQFGAYLKSMPTRVLFKIRRKYVLPDASLMYERFDAETDDALSRHETMADGRAEQEIADIGEYEELHALIAELPAAERHVIRLRLRGEENNAIARVFGVSAATASRMYKRAIAMLRQRMRQTEE
jgi:RNA polymerase sigma factor (sigma-70 family)